MFIRECQYDDYRDYHEYHDDIFSHNTIKLCLMFL